MPTFQSDGVTIAYEIAGDGEPILLIHGFASNGRVNWVDTGWVDALVRDGREVITVDNRGHGNSEKLYDPADYGAPIMANDACRLLDHLGLERADVMGYSMGARIAAFLAIKHPDRVRRVILAGLADNLVKGVGGAEEVAQALEADSSDRVTERMPRTFRLFAEQTGSDLKALAACMRSSRQKIKAEEVAGIRAPTLVVAGSDDDTAGPVAPLVELLPNATGLVIEGRDHMRTVGDKRYKEGVLDFLRSFQS
ncbi:alpha/beta hydrolase [Kaustia mangrovi]|uniref:Alpha/beta hydrolase n=1 Tax=Kaustia mangrovi TaxID=2593653 RepID=A0A7S8C0U0_9HYPH|nr:alpha/beta hydrolase [Kaustia mangrovi]QPC41275.1 alpha/beta hydrolase [Kaustia mangrovi]